MIRHASAVAMVLLLNTTPMFGQSAVAPMTELIIKASPADVHKSPSVASPVIGKAAGGTAFEIRRNLGSWVEVTWPNTEGGIAFLHVNTGTIAPRSAASGSNAARESVAQIAAVAAAATAAVTNHSAAEGGLATGTKAAPRRPATYLSLPPHRIGMGALMNASTPGFGATARTWWAHRIGVQFSVARPQLKSADGRSLTSTQFAPSVLYSLPEGVTASMWLRPYLGAGPRLYRADVETGLGYEAFGGAEATFAAMPQLALSADTGYRWSRPSFNGFAPRRIGFSLSAHWYVK